MSNKYWRITRQILFIILFGMVQIWMKIYAQDPAFSQRQLTVIHLEAKKVLVNYENLTNQLGEAIVNNPGRTREIRESFMELFATNNVWVFNDLDPEHKTSPFFEAETYVNILELSYKDGITIELYLDQAKIGDIVDLGSKRFSVDLKVEKQIYGNYRDHLVNTNLENLLFRVGFIKSENEFKNFRILGIRSLDVDISPNMQKNIEEIRAQKMEPNENDLITQGVTTLINDYSNYLSLIGSSQESNFDKEHYISSFKALFESPDTVIFNDLMPAPAKKFVTIDDYFDLLRLHYPIGIYKLNVTIDSTTSFNVINEDNNNFSVKIGIEKFFSGIFNRQSIFSEEYNLIVKVAFKKNNSIFEDFKIRSIEPEEDSFYEPAEDDFVVPTNELNPVRRKGYTILASGSFSQTWIEDRGLLDLNLESDGHSWSCTPGYALSAGLGIQAYLNNYVSIETGFYLNQYRTIFSIDGDFMDLKISEDVNGDDYYKKYDLRMDSTVIYNLVSIPLAFTFITSKPGKTGLYFTVGGLFSYAHSGKYYKEGTCEYYGYYAENPQVLREIRIEELGFYYNEDVSETRTLPVGQYHFSAISSIGLVIPIKYFTQIFIGPQIEWGLTDFHAGRPERSDIFGETISHGPTYLKRYGLRVGVSVHL